MDEDSRLVSSGVAGLRADAERSMQEPAAEAHRQ